MRRFCAISASFFLLAGLFLGCTKQAEKNGDKQVNIDRPKVIVEQPKGNGKDPNQTPKVDEEKEAKYEEAFDSAIRYHGQRNYAEALKAFKLAQTFKDSDFVQSEIAKLEQKIAAKSTVENIETVLNDGNAEDAAKLANEALKDFGDGDEAIRLVQLSLQADAIQDVEKKEGDAARFVRFRKMATDALAEKPPALRTAFLALELALQAKDDAGLQEKYDDVRTTLDTYDALRKKSAELRADPSKLDEALTTLEDAAKAWDTPQIRTDIAELQLAIEKRRETVSVADFEIRNDIGNADAGADIADEILPILKKKFDIVERHHLKRIISELKLQPGYADDLKQQQHLNKTAKVRYLVVGSIGRRAGVTVLARLVDLRTGMVVQTAKLVVPKLEDAMQKAAEIAEQLMMTDEEKMKWEVAAAPAAAAEPAPDNVKLAEDPLPPPMLDVAPPVFGNQQKDAFKVLAPAPANFVAPDPEPLAVQRRNRLFFATVQMGDFLFRAGRFGDAQRQFEFALVLDPNNIEIQARLDRVRPQVAPIVIIDSAPVRYVRPRLAVLPFMVVGRLPGSLAYWTPSNLAPYFGSRYEVVDAGEVYWYMARMGLTMQDIVNDPIARRWLGRATGIRYFVFGSCIETTSFDVNTYLVDAEFGFLQGRGTINVRNSFELSFRFAELANLTMLTPAERAAWEAELVRQRYGDLVRDGRRHMDQRRYSQAAREFEKALAIYPGDVQVRIWLDTCLGFERMQAVIDRTLRENAARQALLAAQRQRQLDLARRSADSRKIAITAAAAYTDRDRQTRLAVRIDARDAMVTRAQVALNTNRVGISVNFFQAAVGVGAVAGPTAPPVAPAVFQDFAKARLQAEAREARLTAANEATLRKVREQQLYDAQKALVKEQSDAKAKLEATRAAQLKHDDDAFKAGMDQGRRYFTDQKYEAALAAFQGAQRVAHTSKQNEQVNVYIEQIVERQAVKLAKSEDEKKKIAARLDAEKEKRKLAEDRYKLALLAGQQALKDKKLDTAQSKFEEAQTFFKTDAVNVGLQQVKSELAAITATTKKDDALKQMIADGKAALNAKRYGEAVVKFQEAKKLAPQNLDVLAGLAQAQAGDPRPKIDPVDPNKTKLQDLIASGQAALKVKDYDAAELKFKAAKLADPTNAAVLKGLKDIEAGRTALVDAKRLADYQTAVNAGTKAYQAKNYDLAIKSFQQALDLMPKDATAQGYLKQARDAKELAVKSADVILDQGKTLVANGQKALKAKNYVVAAKAFKDAIAKLDPNNANARAAIQEATNGLADANAQITAIQTGFDKAMATGKTAMDAKRFKDAVKAYTEALGWVPGEPTATKQLAAAQKALQDPGKKDPPPDPNKQFTDTMQKADAAAKDKKYSDAVKAYTDALKLRPKDANALTGLRQNQFSLHMETGQQALNNSMWMAAQTEAEAALRLFPTNEQAKKLLDKAKKKMK